MIDEQQARQEIERLWNALPEERRDPAHLWTFFTHDLQRGRPQLLEFAYGRGQYPWERLLEWCCRAPGGSR